MNDKKVMPEDIDYGLVEQIYKGIENDVPTSSLYREDIQTIRATLAWIANNPLVPTEEQQSYLHKAAQNCGKWNSEFFPAEFQRIAFLKKEEELPEEVKALLFDGATSDADYYNKANQRIRAAWKIGAGIK